MLLTILAFNILIPATLVFLLVLLVLISVRFGGPGCYGWMLPAGILGGYIAGTAGLMGLPFPPVDPSKDWMVYAAFVAMLLLMLEPVVVTKRMIWSGRLLLVTTVCWFMFAPLVQYGWSAGETLVNIGLVVVAVLVYWRVMGALAGKAHAVVAGSFLTLFSTFVSVAILLSHSIVLAQLQGVLTSTIGAVSVLYWLIPLIPSLIPSLITYRTIPAMQSVSIQPAIGMVAIISALHIVSAVFFADLQLLTVFLLLASLFITTSIWHRGTGKKAIVFGFAAGITFQLMAIGSAYLLVE